MTGSSNAIFWDQKSCTSPRLCYKNTGYSAEGRVLWSCSPTSYLVCPQDLLDQSSWLGNYGSCSQSIWKHQVGMWWTKDPMFKPAVSREGGEIRLNFHLKANLSISHFLKQNEKWNRSILQKVHFSNFCSAVLLPSSVYRNARTRVKCAQECI